MENLIKDNNGFVSLMDALLSIFILFMVLIAFNMMIDMEIPSESEENNGFKTSQDIMEIMSSKVDGKDYSILDRITYILDQNNNSASSKREVKELLDDFFATYLGNEDNANNNQSPPYCYSFVETNQLNGDVLSSNGDYASADDVNVAIRNYGNYSYKLYLFKS